MKKESARDAFTKLLPACSGFLEATISFRNKNEATSLTRPEAYTSSKLYLSRSGFSSPDLVVASDKHAKNKGISRKRKSFRKSGKLFLGVVGMPAMRAIKFYAVYAPL